MESPSFYRYLSDVLGIESIILPLIDRGEEIAVEGAGPVMFLGSSVLSEAREKDLLLKMIVAMGLDPAQVYIAEGEPSSLKTLETYDFRILILLGAAVSDKLTGKPFETVRGELSQLSKWETLVTHDPKALLKNPDLKKQAWGDLKKVIPLLKA